MPARSAFGRVNSSSRSSTPLNPELLDTPYSELQQDPGLWNSLKDVGVSGLTVIGNTLNKPSRAVWGSASALAGEDAGGGLLNLIPFSDTMGLTDPTKGIEAGQFATNMGWLDENDPNAWEANDFVRFGLDVVGDPTTWLGPGVFGKTGAVAKKAGVLDDSIRATMKAQKVGPRVAGMRTTLKEALDRKGIEAWEAAAEAAQKSGVKLDDLLDKPLGHFGVWGGFGKFLEFGKGQGWEKVAGVLDMPGQLFRKTPLYRGARALFDYRVKGKWKKGEQEVAEAVTDAMQTANQELAFKTVKSDDVIQKGWKAFQSEWQKLNPRKERIGGMAIGDAVNAGGRYGEIIDIDDGTKMVKVRHVDAESGAETFAEYPLRKAKAMTETLTPDQLIEAASKGNQRARVLLEATNAFGDKAATAIKLIDAYAAKWSQSTGLDPDDLFERMTFRKGKPGDVGPSALMQGEPVFYSKLRRAVNEIPDGRKVTLQELEGSLKKKGVKANEMEWNDLKSAYGDKRFLTKAEIKKHLDDNALVLEEELVEDGVGIGGKHGWAEMNKIRQSTDNAKTLVLRAKGMRSGAVGEHYPNALAYVRFGDQFTPDGKRVLHIENLQSDWAQEASGADGALSQVVAQESEMALKSVDELQKGVYHNNLYTETPLSEVELRDLHDTSRRGIMELGGRLAESPDNYNWEAIDKVAKAVADVANANRNALSRLGISAADARNLYWKLTEIRDVKPRREIAAHPFGKTWHEPMMRRVMRYAADNGYDGVSWSSAAEQAARWEGGNPDYFKILYDEKIPSFMKKEYKAKVGDVLPESTVYGGADLADAERNRLFSEGRLAEFSPETAGMISSPPAKGVMFDDAIRAQTSGKQPLFQGGRGAINIDRATRKAVITAFDNADITTMAHEVGHAFRGWLDEVSPDLLKQAEDALGVVDNDWTRGAEEAFAEQFEKYLATGKAPVAGLKAVFQQFKEWMASIYQTIVGTPLEQRMNPKLKKVFDEMLTPKAMKNASPTGLLAQSRAFAAFSRLATASAEGQTLDMAWSQTKKALRLPENATISDVMGASAESVGEYLKKAQDEAYDEYRRMGGVGEKMGGIDGGAKHFARFVAAKLARDVVNSAEYQANVGSRTFGGARMRAPETRHVPTATVNELLEDPNLRVKDADVIGQLQSYVDEGKMALDREWMKDLPIEEVVAGRKLAKDWEQVLEDVASGKLDEAALPLAEETMRQSAHLEDIADYILSHKQQALYTRDIRANQLTYIDGIVKAKAAMSAVHDAIQDAMGTGTVSLRSAYTRAGMDPQRALEYLSDRTGLTVDSLARQAIPEELANALGGVSKVYRDVPEWEAKLGRMIDKVTNAFKAGVTVLPISPAYFFRNAISGHFMNLSSGLVNGAHDFATYVSSMGDALKAAKGEGEWIEEIQANWIGRNQALGGELAKESAIATGVTGLDIRPGKLFRRGRLRDAAEEVNTHESVLDGIPGVKKGRTGWTAAVNFGQDVNAWVEWTNRVPMYIYLRKKGWSTGAAMQQVDRLHFDYGALSPFERKYMRRIIPFYTFSRKMADAVAGDLMNRPGGALSQFIRRSGEANAEATPDLPDHVTDTMAVELQSKDPTGRRFLTGLGLPYEDTASFFGSNPLQELGGRLNPLIKAPIEMALGRTFFQGRDLDDSDPVMGRIAANVMGQDEAVRFNPVLEHLVSNSPLSRGLTSLRTLTDDRKEAWVKGLNVATGARITDVSQRARDAVLLDRVTKVAKQRGGKTFERTYFKKGEEGLKPDQAKLNDVFRALAQRAKAAKKKAEQQ